MSMNRAMKRQAMRELTQKNKALVESFTKQQRVARLIQNGITPRDVENAFEEGRELGFKQAGIPIVKSCYAAICAALHDEFGFDEDQCFRAIKAVDEKTLWALNNQELVDEVLEKTGLEIDFDDALDRVKKTRTGAAK